LLTCANGDTQFSFGAAVKEHNIFFYNDAGFLLNMAIADGTLFGYKCLDDVRKQEIPAGKDEVILRFHDSTLERPILRKCSSTGGVTDDPMPKSSFTDIFKSTYRRVALFKRTGLDNLERRDEGALGAGIGRSEMTES
jgi:hypothetical protein